MINFTKYNFKNNPFRKITLSKLFLFFILFNIFLVYPLKIFLTSEGFFYEFSLSIPLFTLFLIFISNKIWSIKISNFFVPIDFMKNYKNILIVIPTFIFVISMTILINMFIFSIENNFNEYGKIVQDGFSFFNILIILILAPVFEELLVRGYILHRILYIMTPLKGILLVSAIFSLLHGFPTMPGAFIFSIIVIFVFMKTKSILYPILIHFINNLMGVCLSYLSANMNGKVYIFKLENILFLIFLLILSGVILYKFIKKNLKYIYSKQPYFIK